VNLVDHALGYAQQGALVFPLTPGKTPYTENGMKDGTADPVQIANWWNQYPDALIGCRIPERLVVLDIDPRHGGDKVWNALITSYGGFPIGRQHHSGRNDGGFHAWGNHPGGKLSTKRLVEWALANDCATQVKTTSGKLKWTCGIDILHHGHRYSILPPSPHPVTGQPYEWDIQGEPLDFPGWLTDLLAPPAPKQTPPTPARPRDDFSADSIADWYTAQARWSDILVGWQVVGGDGEHDGSKWRHPNASAEWSATITHGCLFVYTDQTDFDQTEADEPHGYTKFRAYAELHHSGNMSDAARAAREMRDGSTGWTVPTAKKVDEPTSPPREEEWPEPIPLIGQRECPPFPVHVLPDWMADQARQVAVEMQYPPDLPAQLAITAVSLCISRRVSVQVDGPWVEGTNIYTVTAMNASAGKSPAVKHMFGPINDFEVDLIEAAAKEIDDRELERKLIEKDIADALKRNDKTQAGTFTDELRSKPPIAKPRLIAEDITPEKLAMVMAEQGGRLALVSTEGGVFQIMAGRYSEASNLDIFLQAWSGDNITQDRVGRESLIIRDARLSVALTVQPIVLTQIGDNGEFKGRGLLARFMYAIPPSTVGTRDRRRRSTWDQAIADRYADRLRSLARRFIKDDCLPVLRLSDAAYEVFTDWQQGHEARMGYNGDLEHLAEWVSKMHSTVCRLAGVIHMAERDDRVEEMTGPLLSEITEETMLRAIVVGDYWVAHARIAGDMWGADPEVDKALRLLRWAQKRRADEGDVFTIRDAMRGLRKQFPKAEAAIPALQILTESGWVRADMPISEWGRGRGGQSAIFTLRPESTTHSATCGQVVTHVTHVPRGESEETHSLTTHTRMPDPRDMGDMGDNPSGAQSSQPATPSDEVELINGEPVLPPF
jgi:replicative DNA helicase